MAVHYFDSSRDDCFCSKCGGYIYVDFLHHGDDGQPFYQAECKCSVVVPGKVTAVSDKAPKNWAGTLGDLLKKR